MRKPFSSSFFAPLLLCAFALSISFPIFAQSSLDDLAATYDTLIPELLAEHGVPGASVAVFRDGEVVWSAGYGTANLETGDPVTADTPFAAWSIAKVLTAAATMQLVEAGQLDLDAPMQNYLTRWSFPTTRQPLEEVTTRRIMSHTAGLSGEGYAGFVPSGDIPTIEQLLDGEGGDRVGVLMRPGQRFLYSGGGYTVLQLAIEELTGEVFADHMAASIFAPLGMEHSTFEWTPIVGEALSYTRTGAPDDRVIHVAQAAGGLYISANDLATFLAVLLNGGGDLITPESVAEIFTPVVELNEDVGYGFGVYVSDGDGNVLISHDGIGFGAQSIFAMFPETNEGIVVLTNHVNGNDLYPEIMCAWDSWSEIDAPVMCDWH